MKKTFDALNKGQKPLRIRFFLDQAAAGFRWDASDKHM
jgi:hypothetical protein